MMFADTFWTLQKILTGVYCVNMTDDPQDKRRISGMKISCIDYVINQEVREQFCLALTDPLLKPKPQALT